jgi:uncharacterized protein (DUF58 family)
MFLGLVAVLINAPALFYMSFALIATIVACNVQSKLATKALRIERIAPKSVHIGELVNVEMVLWSERKLKRPLVTVEDLVPKRLTGGHVGVSLPVAPAYDLPVRTHYQFRPVKRGRFQWKNLQVTATDALGLTTKTVDYETEPTEIIVIPNPIPVSIELPSSSGWGVNEALSGQAAGSGIEPRGIRQYAYGDSLRHVHWRSSARSRTLQVKEFQSGAQGAANFLIQTTQGTDVGSGSITSLDAMCGHALYLCEVLSKQGVDVSFPLILEASRQQADSERFDAIQVMLGTLMADRMETLSRDLLVAAETAGTGTTIYLTVAIEDPQLPDTIRRLSNTHRIVCLIYDPTVFDAKFAGSSVMNQEFALMESGATVIRMPEVVVA